MLFPVACILFEMNFFVAGIFKEAIPIIFLIHALAAGLQSNTTTLTACYPQQNQYNDD